jgi:hypothetical protein
LGEATVEQINRDFADLLAEGQFVEREAWKEEAEEFRLVELPRLSFHFNRRNFGRLRELIDFINETAPPAIEEAGG